MSLWAIATYIAVTLALIVLATMVISIARVRVARELLWALVPVAIIAAAATPAIRQASNDNHIAHRHRDGAIVAQAETPHVAHDVEARSR